MYTKIIRYGEHIEIYEYEREPELVGQRGGERPALDGDVGVGASGENSLSEVQLGKRQDNARHAAVAFRRIVTSNLGGSVPPLLLTLTYKENITDIAVGYQDYRAFVQALRYKYGKAFKYLCVPEFQKRGAVHFHALFWGLPAHVYGEERQTREIAKTWGKGFVFIKETDGNDKLSSYLAKYMAKAFTDPRLKNKKAYVASRNILRPIITAGPLAFGTVIDEYTDGAEVITDKTYPTKWLGTCRYRHFKIPKQETK